MAFESVKTQAEQKVAPEFQATARVSAPKAKKGLAAFLGGMLLFTFTAVATVDSALASGNHGPTPPTTEELAQLKQYPDIKSLLAENGDAKTTGLHDLAAAGTLGMIDPALAAQLKPSDLGKWETDWVRTDATVNPPLRTVTPGRRVADTWIMSKRVQYSTPQMKELLHRYSEGLDRVEQLRLASLAAEYGGFDLISTDKLLPEDIIAPIVVRIPVGLEQKEKIVESNLMLDTLRNRVFDKRMKDLADKLTPLQRIMAAAAADEFGGTLGHYMAQDAARNGVVDIEMIEGWKEAISWAVADVTGVTPMQILARRPDILIEIFPADNDTLLVAVDTRAWEQMVLSHSVLDQSDEVLHAILTPEFLLSSPSGDGRTVASKLKPECLEKYFTPRVMGGWTEDQVRDIWNAINPANKHDSAIREAFRDILRLVNTEVGQGPTQPPVHQPG